MGKNFKVQSKENELKDKKEEIKNRGLTKIGRKKGKFRSKNHPAKVLIALVKKSSSKYATRSS